MNTFTQDLRLALRMLLKSPGFTAVAIAALALGIGANTAIFSVVNGVLLQPLPFKDANRLMQLERKYPDSVAGAVSIPKFTTWKQQNRVLDNVAAYDFAGPGLNLGGGEVPEQVKGIHVSADFFPLFGADPAVGRVFSAEEDRPGGPRLAVLSHGLWKRRYGSDPGLMGKPIDLNGDPYTVIGVVPQSFRSYPPADIYIPLQADPNSSNQGHFLTVAGRLKPGVTVKAAQAQMKIVGEQFRQAFPDWMGKNESVAVVPLQESMVGDTRPALLVLTGAVGFVLLIACANVANLLLARAAARGKEIAIRTALGAGRWRVIRQLLTESLLLASIGGVLGLLLGSWGLRVLLAISPGDIPRSAELTSASLLGSIDARVFVFTLAVSLLTGILFGLVPALQISKPDLNSTLKESSSRSSTGRHHYARSALVVSEMALALVLLICAALMIRSFVTLRGINPGFDPHNVLTLQVSLNGSTYSTTAGVELLTKQLLERIEGLPGVEAASSTIMIPPDSGVDLPFVIEGRALAGGDRFHGDVQWRYAGPHYFKAFGTPLLRGRVFNEQDNGKASPVAIISDAMAHKFWPNEDPLGKQITIGGGLGPEFKDETRQIVGVVGSMRQQGLSQPASETMYIPYGQVPDGLTRLGNKIVPVSWIVRTKTEPRSLSAAIEREFLAVDRQLPVSNIRTMEQVITEATARQSFNMLLLTIFAAIALLLAAIGIYGVMSYSVEQRTHEIGIRMALGARGADMLRLVVGQGMRLAVTGVAAGLLAAYGLTRLLASLLFGIKASDPVTFGTVAGILAAVALCACYIPARRATKVDPIIALRYE